jgi:hypothetical protein
MTFEGIGSVGERFDTFALPSRSGDGIRGRIGEERDEGCDGDTPRKKRKAFEPQVTLGFLGYADAETWHRLDGVEN